MSAHGTWASAGRLAALLLASAVVGHAAAGSKVASVGAEPCLATAASSVKQQSIPGGCRVAKAAPVLLQTATEHRHPGAAGGEPALLQPASGRHSGETDVDGCNICPGSPYKGSTVEIVNNCGYTVNVHTDAGNAGKCTWDGTKFPSCLRDLSAGGHATVHLKEGKGIYSFQIGKFGKSTRFEITVWNDTWSSPAGKATDSWDISYNAGFDIGMSVTLPAGGFMPEVVATHAASPAAYQLGGDGCQVQPCSSPTWNGPPGHYKLYLCNRPGDVDTPGPCGCKPCPGIECDPNAGGQVCTTSGGGIYCQVGGNNCPLACHGVPTLSGAGDCLTKCPSSEAVVPPDSGLHKKFEAVDGGADRACRGATATDNSQQYYAHSSAASLDDCKALFAALDLGLFDRLAAGPAAAAELGAACEVSAPRLQTLLTALVATRCLRFDPESEKYTNSPNVARFMVSSSKHYYGDYFKYQIGRLFYHRMGRLSEVMNGGEVLDYQTWFSDPQVAATYTSAQHNGSLATARAMLKKVDLSGVAQLLDVGGGSGAFSVATARAVPGLRSTVLELPEVCRTGAGIVEREGLSSQIRYVELDATSPDWPVEAGAFQAVLMSYLSGSVPADAIVGLYSNALKALVPGGRLVVHDFMVNDSLDGPQLGALWALQHVAVNPQGLGLCPANVASRMKAAGFARTEALEMIGGMTKVVVGYKA